MPMKKMILGVVLQKEATIGILNQIIQEITVIQHQRERNQGPMTMIVYKKNQIFLGVCNGC